MRKTIYISILLMSFFVAAQAQKKIVYEDSSLLQKDEPVPAPAEEIEEITTKTIEAPLSKDEDAEEKVDTALHRNFIIFSYDSIRSWRNAKESAYTKYLDSLLRNLKKKEVKNETPSIPRRSIFSGMFSSGIIQ